jgi:universal stress protein A
VLGSVAEHVLRKAAMPTMVVPPGVNSPPVSSEIHLKRFVCAVDFSESSLSALAYALSLAEESDGELDMIHVIELTPETVEAAVAAHFDLARVRAKAEATIRARLESLIPESTRACCTVNTMVAEGRVANVIVALARDRGSDVIVMGVHGRGALDLALFGSKTHEVIRRAGVPVLTVRSGR